ncbi:ATP-binding cassette domain-containing protein [Acetobacterium paludosum]|uniref:Nickel import system ATP-binding protein NikD n=1 Tax=Acetobacterium paludosum TaxID=52693 RepID=A0A923I0I9_9FIRM|nr:ABC transporter ATP-binding protein [Acetobacterium paludosum]MBC3887878.1 ATP-binding cassette domain-containing protein [Acetobacterium paludosum]
MKKILSITGLTIDSQLMHGSHRIVNDLSFELEQGETLAIVGESGCGKTMTALSIFGLLPENCTASGTVTFDDCNLLSLREKELSRMRGIDFVLIPQSGADFLNPGLKVRTQIYETLKRTGIKDKRILEKTACDLLNSVSFQNPDSIMNKYPFQLSGGMAQRVVLAMGLTFSPKLVISDEPTRGIDSNTSMAYLKELTSVFSDSGIVIITHDISVADYCKNIFIMYAGECMEYGDCTRILNNPSHPYTKSLIAALPINGFSLNSRKASIPQDFLNTGCTFYPHCPQSTKKCQTDKPEKQIIDQTKVWCHHVKS